MTKNELVLEDTKQEKKIIKIYWVSVSPDSKTGFIEKIILPNDNELHFNHEQGNIDLEPLTGFLNYPCEFYKNNEYKWLQVFTGLGEIDGIKHANFKTFENIERDKNGTK
ncbi:hypothetical protein M3Y14_34670 (plasmid) [Bacillus thuringiensis]|uniref:hypothetical protein n=1 Tax=Bacillus thuringiensis TaxID=1428 RepID=UPI002224D72D|nr:hypothetical protein [Bacillus thuringiensis]UYX56127.1 hypothetical protein M3Y14_34670 [Bacillus thuringiensis]